MYGSGSDIRTWPIALLRVYTGIFFLYYGINKALRDEFDISGFLAASSENSFAFYRGILDSVIMPNAGLFAWLVTWGEVALGIALILGIATRYAALAGAFMVANFWFTKGQGFLAANNHDSIWLVILLVLALVPAGRVLGLDHRLSDRYRFLR